MADGQGDRDRVLVERLTSLDDGERVELLGRLADREVKGARQLENWLESGIELVTGGGLDGELGRALEEELLDPSERSSRLRVGDHVGRVRLEAPIGHGGMSEVFRGHDELLDRRVAVKALHRNHRPSLEARSRFFREARILASLDHENICQLYDLIETSDGQYLVLELVNGESLEEIHRESHDPISIALQITRALEAAHRAGIVHRDLKPANVMVTRTGAVKVLDFGVARSRTSRGQDHSSQHNTERALEAPGELTTAGQVIGTPAYMSPEQWQGLAVDAPSDLYSCGLLLHKLFCGRSPLGSAAGEALREQVLAGRSRIAPEIEAGMRDLIGDLLSVDPDARPSAAEARKRIERIAGRSARLRKGLLTAVGLAAAIWWLAVGRLEAPLLSEDQLGRVAVLPFENASNDESLEWIEQGLPEMVGQSLDSVDGIDVVSFVDLKAAGSHLAIDIDELGADRVRSLSRAVGAQFLVAAEFRGRPSELVVGYRVLGGVGSSGERRFRASSPLEAAAELSARLAGRFRPDAEFAGLTDTYSENSLANGLFARGTHAKRSRSFLTSTYYFRAAADIDARFWQAQLELADSLGRSGGRQEGVDIAQRVLQAAEKDEARDVRASALTVLGLLKTGMVDDTGASESLDLAADVFAELGMVREQARAVYLTTNHFHRRWIRNGDRRDLDESVARARRASQLLHRLEDPISRIQALYYDGLAASRTGDNLQAKAIFENAVALATQDSVPLYLGLSLIVLADLQEKPAEEQRLLERAAEVHLSIDNLAGASTALRNLGRSLRREGRAAEAEAAYQRAIELARRVSDTRLLGFGSHNLARLLIDEGAYDEAIARLEAGESEGWASSFTARLLAEAFYRLDQGELAVRHQERARAADGPAFTAVDRENLAKYRRLAAVQSSPGGV